MNEIVKALEGHDVGILQRIATKLKEEGGGEGWEIGEMVERAIKKHGSARGIIDPTE